MVSFLLVSLQKQPKKAPRKDTSRAPLPGKGFGKKGKAGVTAERAKVLAFLACFGLQHFCSVCFSIRVPFLVFFAFVGLTWRYWALFGLVNEACEPCRRAVMRNPVDKGHASTQPPKQKDTWGMA